MNKLTKGSLAAGAGLVLLLGGTGTFMSWNDQEALTGGVSAGQLKVDALTDGTWTVSHQNGIATTVDNIDGFSIVPGDKVTYTVPMEVTAEGENLTATLALTPGSIVAAGGENPAADQRLAKILNANTTLDLASDTLQSQGENTNTYQVPATDDATTYPVTATVTMEFPINPDGFEDESNDDAAMNGSVSFDGMNVQLTQNTTPAV